MEYKYPIETHNSVGFKNTSDFNHEAFETYLSTNAYSNRSGYLTCSYDELKNILGNPIKLSASFMYPDTLKKMRKFSWFDDNYFYCCRGKNKDYFLSDVVWFVNLTDYRYKGRKNADWFTIRNFGNGMNMERFLKKNHARYSQISVRITDSFEDKIKYLKRNYSRYASDSRTYDCGFGSASIWLDEIIKNLDAFGLCRYSPVKPKDNINWLISKHVYHGDHTYREMSDTQQILNYYLEENRT